MDGHGVSKMDEHGVPRMDENAVQYRGWMEQETRVKIERRKRSSCRRWIELPRIDRCTVVDRYIDEFGLLLG